MIALLQKHRRLLQFGTVGVSGVLVNMACVWGALRLLVVPDPELRDAMASALGIVISVLSNFLLNDAWTWGDRAKGSWLHRLLRYYTVSAAAALLQFGCAMGLRLLLSTDLYLAQLAGIGLGTVVNYVANNVWTFRDRG
jgi:dolichol-phosphate mannosyltransferase